ncbi:UNVERIFIED_CONTAM: hypothetical protein O8I53_13510 [Campylobacter lari]
MSISIYINNEIDPEFKNYQLGQISKSAIEAEFSRINILKGSHFPSFNTHTLHLADNIKQYGNYVECSIVSVGFTKHKRIKFVSVFANDYKYYDVLIE